MRRIFLMVFVSMFFLLSSTFCYVHPEPVLPSEPRKYSFRKPDYSLLEEPQRFIPETLGESMPEPDKAVVFGLPIRWWFSHWSGKKLNTSCVAMKQHEKFARFIVNEPGRRKVWVKYFDVPIDPQRYPVAVLTYRARHTKLDSSSYVLYLDDGSGPDYGGLLPFRQHDIVPDNQVRTLTCDLSVMNPIGDLIGLAVGVHCDDEGSAEFDLLDLRFEAFSDEMPYLVVKEEEPISVMVVDGQDQVIAGATVTVDAERSNWAWSEVTDEQGLVEVMPYKTKSGRHMIRVTMPGMIPVEVRDLPPGDNPIVVMLEPAVTYGGVVVGGDGQPLARATVFIRVDYKHPDGLWTRLDATVMTDEDGHWQSPLLPMVSDGVKVRLAHPDYTLGRKFGATYLPDIGELEEGTVVLSMEETLVKLQGRVVDEDSRPVEGTIIKDIGTDLTVTSAVDGSFEIKISDKGGIVLVKNEGYVPELFQINAEEESIEIALERGQTIRGQVLDPEGKPISGAFVRLYYRVGIFPWGSGGRYITAMSVKTDEEGIFEWLSAPDEENRYEISCQGFVKTMEKLIPQDEPHMIFLSPKSEVKKEEDNSSDPRRPGYDPFKIFRRHSSAVGYDSYTEVFAKINM